MTDYEKFKQEKKKAVKESTKAPDNNLAVGKVIFGTDRDFPKKIQEIGDINDGSGKVLVQGEIFQLEIKDIYGGRILYKFDIIDEKRETAISCKVILDRKNPGNKALHTYLKKGISIMIFGEAQ